ncbi:tripartite tricarboxylate transporter TctB family protein [Primorskyibacter sedentarius]|uniref:Tripartite tricarboxylate transporter TctB family protein n=1 Tax=Primorskyibacter sedentarius TaxID=745311 RepID=A0A4R3J304_9RHOB|nr:tripartite tricarboxylate transporter TctB family protein [Primorskyibacter sedentarius]TCS59000.1 tripartite tricarboxylate transporter TctB family protein [Primorskyibacter sedentarius]
MLSQRVANIVFSVLLLAACGYFIDAAIGFDDLSLPGSTQLSSKFFPITILLFIAGCSGIVLVQYILDKGDGLRSDETVFLSKMSALHGLLTFAVIVGCYLIWRNYGFVPAALVLGPAAALAMGVRKPAIYVALVVISMIFYFAFTRLLAVQL